MGKIALKLFCSFIISGVITGCGSSNQSQTNQEAISVSTSSLSTFALNCQIKDVNGTPVNFSNTVLPKDRFWSEQKLCLIAGDMVDKAYQQGKEAMSFFCDTADKAAAEFGGGSYDLAIQKYSSLEQNAEIRTILNTLQMCKTKESRFNAVKQAVVESHVYSVGSFTYKGKPCHGYIYGLSPRDKSIPLGDSVAYSLDGIDDCADFRLGDFSNEIYFPDIRPHLPAPGTYISNNFQYTGVMPNSYRYKGKDYPFFN